MSRKLIILIFLVATFLSCSKKDELTHGKTSGVPEASALPLTTISSATVSTLAGVNTSSLLVLSYPSGMAIDGAGNMYIADHYNNRICKLSPTGVLSNFAGSGAMGSANGKGLAATFWYPSDIVIDAAGNLIVTDTDNSLIRKITMAGVVTTIAGSGAHGWVDGFRGKAVFYYPQNIAIDTKGNLYVTDNGSLIRKITPAGFVSTLAGSLKQVSADGTGSAASFDGPEGIGADTSGNVYVADHFSNLIRKITPAGVVTTLAGSGALGSANGRGKLASFGYPVGLVLDKTGNIYVADQHGNSIRKITPAGIVSTFAGTGQQGDINGAKANATFNEPQSLAFDATGNLYTGEGSLAPQIRKISTAGIVSSVEGGTGTPVNGPGNVATFIRPTGLVVDAAGNIYVADAGNNLIRKINPSNMVSTLAGNGQPGHANGNLATASFLNPTGIALDAHGNLFVADNLNNTIRKITPAGLVGSMALFVSANGASGPSNYPTGVAVNKNGLIYYTNSTWNTICVVSPTVISTFSDGVNPGSSNGMFFNQPFGVAVDATGNVYIADTQNHRIVKVTPAGVETTVAGSVDAANFPVGGKNNGKGTAASFYNPKGIAVDAAGNMYIADSGNNLIRKITPQGVVTTVAGTSAMGSANGAGSLASFNDPEGIAVNAAGTIIYVGDTGNGIIRKIILN